ncbi:MAG TPA: YciI-like protein [Candidatus Acidoferrum sp.]|nr:YciI-like protein [Candidatus Acidoferrum sp.]
MGYYALFYREVVPEFVQRRTPFREEHLRLAREAHANGQLVLAGALADPPDGALLVFRTADPGPVQEFVRKDPYVINGLVKTWEIRPWTVVIGNE